MSISPSMFRRTISMAFDFIIYSFGSMTTASALQGYLGSRLLAGGRGAGEQSDPGSLGFKGPIFRSEGVAGGAPWGCRSRQARRGLIASD
jgi:hypothetical protein